MPFSLRSPLTQLEVQVTQVRFKGTNRSREQLGTQCSPRRHLGKDCTAQVCGASPGTGRSSRFGLKHRRRTDKGTGAAVLSDTGHAGVALVPRLAAPPGQPAGLALSRKTRVSEPQLAQSAGEAVSICLRTRRAQPRSPGASGPGRACLCPGRRQWPSPLGTQGAGSLEAPELPSGQLQLKPFLRGSESEPSRGAEGESITAEKSPISDLAFVSSLLPPGKWLLGSAGTRVPTQKSDVRWTPRCYCWAAWGRPHRQGSVRHRVRPCVLTRVVPMLKESL